MSGRTQLPLTCSGGASLREDLFGHNNFKVKSLRESIARKSVISIYSLGERSRDMNLWLMSVNDI